MNSPLEHPARPETSDHRPGPHGYRAVLALLAALAAWSLLPFLGLGTYRTPNGQTFFTLWYLIGFMVLAFFLMHEFITPAPKRLGEKGSGPEAEGEEPRHAGRFVDELHPRHAGK